MVLKTKTVLYIIAIIKRSPFFSCCFTAVLPLQMLTFLKGRWHYPVYTDELTQGHLVSFPRQLLRDGIWDQGSSLLIINPAFISGY